MQFVQFSAFLVLFLAYMSVAVYGNDPSWTTSELVAYPQGRAAVALECILMVMMFGQVRRPMHASQRLLCFLMCCLVLLRFRSHAGPGQCAKASLCSHHCACFVDCCWHTQKLTLPHTLNTLGMLWLQAADEAKQMVTYKQDYFNSPWNYFDCASIVIISMLFLLHITRLNHQVRRRLSVQEAVCDACAVVPHTTCTYLSVSFSSCCMHGLFARRVMTTNLVVFLLHACCSTAVHHPGGSGAAAAVPAGAVFLHGGGESWSAATDGPDCDQGVRGCRWQQ